jgi:hypothetical protein
MEPQVNDTAPHMIRSQLRLSNSVVSSSLWYPNLAAWFLLSTRNSFELHHLAFSVLPAFRRQTYILTFRARRVNPSASTSFCFPSESVWASAVRRISKIPLFRDCPSAKGWRSYVGQASNASLIFVKFPSHRPTRCHRNIQCSRYLPSTPRFRSLFGPCDLRHTCRKATRNPASRTALALQPHRHVR